ncbi:glucosaminidase domain-containing protein [Mucilaginibacter mali]|uniref:Glucosaminidase domain-containing protein n=1 Tax=Mucilaginibacter mali TaxID=2740462 RepID=A0A7D4UMH6_9SPHI|nr:glucosaminidase domain-containing protein [Mucilaginibacter mali]QKJ28240.1 glucosaminidase domain-containing protein [Mucilaginibacter mali]
MKKTVLLTILVSVALCVSAQNKPKNTSQSYIEKFKDNAIEIMHQSGIPASIILGIAMHESGSGNSAIAQNLNNQFGMKGGGTSVYYKNKKKVRSAYKAYDSILDSFQDFARVITEKKKFAHLADQLTSTDYVGWVKGIERAGYASSKKWGRDVLAIINKYNLNSLDAKTDSTEFTQAPVKDQQ